MQKYLKKLISLYARNFSMTKNEQHSVHLVRRKLNCGVWLNKTEIEPFPSSFNLLCVQSPLFAMFTMLFIYGLHLHCYNPSIV